MLEDCHRQAHSPLGSLHKEPSCLSLARSCQQASASSDSAHHQFSLGTGVSMCVFKVKVSIVEIVGSFLFF